MEAFALREWVILFFVFKLASQIFPTLNRLGQPFNQGVTALFTIPRQSHHPLRGFVEDWLPREFGSTLEPDAIKAVPSAEFTSGRRDGR